jgi:hypothetical protein
VYHCIEVINPVDNPIPRLRSLQKRDNIYNFARYFFVGADHYLEGGAYITILYSEVREEVCGPNSYEINAKFKILNEDNIFQIT